MTTQPLRIVYAGTPEIASTILQQLLVADENIVALYTQPDKPAGRGRKLTMSPVKVLGLKHGIDLFQPASLKDLDAQQQLQALRPDLMIVMAYGLILPQAVLDIPTLGCINIHTSLLPRWRGAAPIQRAILAGDKKTGVSIMQMEAGLDTGPVIYQDAIDITENETSQSLHDKLASVGGSAILHTLQLLREDRWQPTNQDDVDACYAAKIDKTEAHIDWQQTAVAIERQIRGFYPWPVAYTTLADQRLRIYQGKVLAENSDQPPGTIIGVAPSGLSVATGQGMLQLQRVQLPGGKPLAIKDLLNAYQDKFSLGACFGS